MKRLLSILAAVALTICTVAVPARAQAPTPIQMTTPASNIVVIPISATAAVNTQTTLTIPTPPGGLSNYVCFLAYNLSNDGTGGVVTTNGVSTATNFNSFAVKVSNPGTASTDSGTTTLLGPFSPATGCVKSTIPGTATTFVSTASLTHTAWTWYAAYYQAP